MTNDPYAVLGLPRDASLDEVKKRYRELALKYHPDKYTGNELADLAQEKMKALNEAYDAIVRERDGRGTTGGYEQQQPWQQNTGPYRQQNPYERQPYGGGQGCSVCDCCTAMICADCLCNCC